MAPADIWDRQEEILNTPAGPYNLRTARPATAAKEMYCTQSTAVPPDFKRPKRWLKFLKEIFPDDPERIEFVQRYLGYAATGYTREQCLMFAQGDGANGKGVLFNTIANVLGGYAKTVDPDMFTLAGAVQHKSALAALVGKRFVLAQEIPDNTHWNEARIKMLTGSERIEANFMRAEKFEFTPQCSIVICSNPKPHFKSVDTAIRRRFHFVRFKASFIGKMDRTLEYNLREEWPQILGWVLQGAKKYLESGLPVPPEIERETAVYMDDADTLKIWLGDVTFDENLNGEADEERYWHPLSRVLGHYQEFTRKLAVRSVGRDTLVSALQDRGVFEQRRRILRYSEGRARYWGPIRLLSN